jgi:hypothetical protein
MPFEEIPGRRKLDFRLAEIPPDVQLALSDDSTQIALQSWALLKQGYDRFTISRKLKLPQELVDDILQRFREYVVADAGRMLESYRVLDCERVEDLIQHWWPMATGCSLDKILADEMAEDDFERCLKAGYVVLNAIEKRMNILLAGQTLKTTKGEILVSVQNALNNGDGAASTRNAPVLDDAQ